MKETAQFLLCVCVFAEKASTAVTFNLLFFWTKDHILIIKMFAVRIYNCNISFLSY